jgi:hypothetical protein
MQVFFGTSVTLTLLNSKHSVNEIFSCLTI